MRATLSVLAALGALALLATMGAGHEIPDVHLNVTAHDTQSCGAASSCWFTVAKNEPDDAGNTETNPDLSLPRGATVHLTFENDGELFHSVRIGGTGGETEIIGPGETIETTFEVPWDAPDSSHYWCTNGNHAQHMNGTHTATGDEDLPPDVSLETPTDGATVQGTVDLKGDALDPEAGDDVTVEVQLPPDDGAWREVGGADWSTTWDTTRVSDGTHMIRVRALDHHDLVATLERTVEVANEGNEAPTVTVQNPPDGGTVDGLVTVSGEAEDPEGNLETVEVQLPDGDGWTEADGLESWSVNWNAGEASEGNHTLRVRAVDGLGVAATANVTVRVVHDRDNSAPSLAVEKPKEGDTLEGEVNFTGTVSDPEGDEVVVTVDLPDEGPTKARSDGEARWYLEWNASTVEPGTYNLSFQASDGQATSDAVERTVTVESSGPDQAPRVMVREPAAEKRLRGEFVVTVDAEAVNPDDEVERVRVRIAGGPWTKANPTGETRWRARLSAAGVDPGLRVITAEASDGDLAAQAYQRVYVLGAPPPTPPNVTLENRPEDPVSGLVGFRVDLQDDHVRDPPLHVELRVDGTTALRKAVPKPEPVTLAWQSGHVDDGPHDVAIQAFEAGRGGEPVELTVQVGAAATESAGLAETPTPAWAALVGLGAAAASRRLVRAGPEK